jgi:hypothetical protein
MRLSRRAFRWFMGRKLLGIGTWARNPISIGSGLLLVSRPKSDGIGAELRGGLEFGNPQLRCVC